MLRRLVFVAGLTVVGFVGGAGVANAWTYGPLVVKDGSTTVGQTKGDFNQLTSGTGVGGTHYRYDSRPGGSGIYSRIDYEAYGALCGTPGAEVVCYSSDGQDKTARWYSSSWSSGEYESNPYRYNGWIERGYLYGCMDKNNMPDPCSTPAVKSYNY